MIAAGLARARQLLRQRPARYLMVAAICALTNNVLLIAGARWGFGYVALMAVTWAAGGTLGYLLHARFTFVVAWGPGSFARFMAGIGAGVPAGYLVLVLLARGLALPMWVAAPVQTAVMVIYNYVNARIALLWRRR